MLIVLSGKARSGKDTTADILMDYIKETKITKWVEATAYADCLKETIGRIFGLDERHLYGDLKEEPLKDLPIRSKSGVSINHNWTPRKLFQYIGTDVFRRIDPDCWLNVVRREVLSNCDTTSYIITDARFKNEIDWVLEAGGFHIHIERDRKDYCSDVNHKSENALPEFEESDNVFIIKNNGTLEDLENKIIKVFNTWRNRDGRKEIFVSV